MNNELTVKHLLNSLKKHRSLLLICLILFFVFFLFKANTYVPIIKVNTSIIVNNLDNEDDLKNKVLSIMRSKTMVKTLYEQFDSGGNYYDFSLMLKRRLSIASARYSKVIHLSFKGLDEAQSRSILNGIINNIDILNEEVGLSSQKPLVTIIDEPYVVEENVKETKIKIVVINTLAVMLTLIAGLLLFEYIRFYVNEDRLNI